MGRVMHFEIHASEPLAMIDFYSALLGWKFSQWQGQPYWLVDTGPADQPGINGGLVQRNGAMPSASQPVNAFVCTAQVDDLDAALARVGGLGGSLALPRMAVPGVGWLAYVKDPDENILGLMQPDTAAA